MNYAAVAVHGWLLALFLVSGSFGYAFAALTYAVVDLLLSWLS